MGLIVIRSPDGPPSGSSGGILGGSAPSGPPGGVPAGPAQPTTDNGPQTVIIVWILVAMSTVFLGLRIYCKKRIATGLWWDDWVLILSWICFLVDASMTNAVVSLGFGKYPMYIDFRVFPMMGLYANLGQTFGILAVLWSKTSFAITLLRLTEGKTKFFIWFVIVSMNVTLGFLALCTWIQCTPVAKTWNKRLDGTCWDISAVNGYNIFTGVYSGACDIVLAMLPWRLIWNLQMKKKEKFGVGIAMSMGLFAGSTAFIKTSKVPTLGTNNFTVEGCALLLWAGAEISTTIMAACIPSMRVLVREVGSSMKRSYAPQSISKKSAGTGSGSGSGKGGSKKLDSMPSTVDSGTRSRIASYPPSISPIEPVMTPMNPLGSSPVVESHVKADDSSEKSFLPIQGYANSPPPYDSKGPLPHHDGPGPYRGDGIMTTHEIEVEYHSRSESGSRYEYEMTAIAL